MGGVTQKWWVQTLFFDRGTCYTLSLSSQQWFCLMYRLFEHVAHLAKPLCIFLKPPFQEKHVVFKFATKQNSFFTHKKPLQTKQLVHKRNLSNKPALTHKKPFKQGSFYTQQAFQTKQFSNTTNLQTKPFLGSYAFQTKQHSHTNRL